MKQLESDYIEPAVIMLDPLYILDAVLEKIIAFYAVKTGSFPRKTEFRSFVAT